MRRYKDDSCSRRFCAHRFPSSLFFFSMDPAEKTSNSVQRQAQLPEKSTKRITTRFWEWTETPLLRSFENRTSDWLLSTIPTGAVTQRSYPFPGRLMRSSRKSRWRTASSPTRRRNKCTMSMARRESRKEPTRSSTNRSIRSTSSPPSSLRDSMMTPFRFLPSVISFRHRENTVAERPSRAHRGPCDVYSVGALQGSCEKSPCDAQYLLQRVQGHWSTGFSLCLQSLQWQGSSGDYASFRFIDQPYAEGLIPPAREQDDS